MLRISIAVLVAFILGATLTFVIIKSTLDSKPITADSTKTIATTAFVSNPLTNPYLATTSARHLYWKPIADFTPQIKTYIDSMVSMHKGIRISYYFRDLTNAVTININPDELYSPASIMKLPIMLAVFRREEASPGFLKRSIPYKAEKMGNVYNPDCAPLVDNQLYSIETLLKRMVQESDNVSTFMLLDEVGIHQVKAVERSMNIELEIDAQAEDDRLTIAQCASFFRSLFNATGLKKENSEKALKMLTGSKYSHGIKKALPKSILFAQKYGIRINKEALANGQIVLQQLHQLGIVYHPSKPFLIAVMIKYDNRQVMDDIMFTLGKITYQSVHNNVPENFTLSISDDIQ